MTKSQADLDQRQETRDKRLKVSGLRSLVYCLFWLLAISPLAYASQIKDIQVSTSETFDQIVISLTASVEPKVFFLEEPLRLVVDFPDTIFEGPKKTIKADSPRVSEVRAAQFDIKPFVARVALELKDKIPPYRILREENRVSVELGEGGPPAIVKIKAFEEAQTINLEILADRVISFEAKALKDPDRIVIEIPGALFPGRKIRRFYLGPLIRTRSSQLKKSGSARVVVDLTQPVKYKITLSSDKKMILLSVVKPKKGKALSLRRLDPCLKDKVIVIEPGHGGKDPGAVGRKRSLEKEENLKTSLRLCKMLAEAGAIPLLTREDDVYMNKEEIVEFANQNKADIFISFHYNSSWWPWAKGIETYIWDDRDKRLAEEIQKSLVRTLNREDRGVKKEKYFTVHHTDMPAILVEPAYISNREEEKLILTEAFQEKIARAILEGLCRKLRM